MVRRKHMKQISERKVEKPSSENSFDCYAIRLEFLKACPRSIYDGSFDLALQGIRPPSSPLKKLPRNTTIALPERYI